MKPFGGLGRSKEWRRNLVAAVTDVLPQIGSGIAAKQYDPGAPFFASN
jgi:hypothetical protein